MTTTKSELPLISCIVPVFNGEQYLGEALDSILAQGYRPIEVIVVDDGSTDNSAQIASSYGPPVRVVHQANAGPAAARNTGIRESAGEFIAFLDADDLWHEDKLEVQMKRFSERPELDMCTAHVKNFWIPELAHEEEKTRAGQVADVQAGVSPTLVAKRALFDRVGLFDASLHHHDAADWARKARDDGAEWEVLPDVLLQRRIHLTNRSRQRSEVNDRNDLLRMVEAKLQRQRAARKPDET